MHRGRVDAIQSRKRWMISGLFFDWRNIKVSYICRLIPWLWYNRHLVLLVERAFHNCLILSVLHMDIGSSPSLLSCELVWEELKVDFVLKILVCFFMVVHYSRPRSSCYVWGQGKIFVHGTNYFYWCNSIKISRLDCIN